MRVQHLIIGATFTLIAGVTAGSASPASAAVPQASLARFAAALPPAAATVDQIGVAAIGLPKAVLDPSGVKLSVVVNSLQDSPADLPPSPPSGGRWVVLDVTVTNVGINAFDLTAGAFQLMSPQTLIYVADGAPDVAAQQLQQTTIPPGQTIEGKILFALPAGVMLQAVTFQASGTAQWIIALLS